MFETKGVVDREFTQRTYRALNGRTMVKVGMSFFAIFAILTVVLILMQLYYCAFLMFAIAICMLLRIPLVEKQAIKVTLLRNLDFFETEVIVFHSSFSEENIQIYNQDGTPHITMPYSAFVKMAEFPDIYMLISRSGQYVAVFKNGLDEQQQKDFVAFIDKKIPNIVKLQRKK